ncbi:IS110 family transposase [Patescibacteria group bacterium]|nr:IS110 family transposase [Patescibacteria group bacterium]
METITNFIGIDMAKASFMAAFDETNDPEQFDNTSQSINSFFKRLSSLGFSQDNTILGVESTGSYHLKLSMACQAIGYTINIINPLIVKKHNQTDLRRVKNDKKDAKLIRYCLAQGHGYPFQTTESEFKLKALIRQRNRLSAFRIQLHRQDQDIKLKEQSLKAKINPIYAKLEKQVAKQIKQIESQLKQFNQPIQELLETIPGVGPITAASFISEITNINKFNQPKRLTAYIGIDPRVHESGTSIKGKGYITKRGNKILRTILFNAASVAVLHSNMFQRFFQKKRSEGKPYRVALVATMRKMAHVIHAVWTNNTPYKDNYHLSTQEGLTGI